jgi:OOP family OmpA-OmpF porin
MMPKGYGADKPVGSNDTEEGRQLNRRIEFKVIR